MEDIFVYISLMFTSILDSTGQAHSKQNVIQLDNVCIVVRHGYDYNIISNIDYFQVDVNYNGARGHVYVGYNPQILGSNRKWESMSLRDNIKLPTVVSLEGSQAGQFLGVPSREEDKFFHLWFEKIDQAAMLPIKEVVGFCK
jgi:hypothetical protein